MPLFVFYGKDGPRGIELRNLHRKAHMENMTRLDQAGMLLFAGPLRNGAGQSTGSLIIFEAEDEPSASLLMQADPYTRAGVFGSFEVLMTLRTFPQEKGEPESKSR